MHYILLLVTILMWSFVGILVKSASWMVNSSVITLCRFLFGIVFLAVFILIRDKKLSVCWNNKWIWIGMAGKCFNYIFENIAISMGYAYGNVIVGPIQAVFLTIVSVLFLKEEIYKRKIAAVVLCVAGVFLVSWNGAPVSMAQGTNLWIPILFTLSAVGAGTHLMSQRMLIEHMDSANMNFSMFLLSTIFTAVPVPFTFAWTGNVSGVAILSLLALGFITGISFYMYAKVLKKIPFLIAVIAGNSSVLFTLVWSRLFFHEPITKYIIAGAGLFVVGLVVLNLPKGKWISRSKAMSQGT